MAAVRHWASVAVAWAGIMAMQPAAAGFVVFEASGVNALAITATRDAFRSAVGGGAVAGANGSFGGLRREINWDGVPNAFADPNPLPANFFNLNSARGVEFSTPGTGFLVSANAGQAASPLFGFASDFQAFSAQRLFTAVNSNITDVHFFVPGTGTAATTTAFGLVFTDVEVADLTRLQLFDELDNLIFDHYALTSGNQGLTFLGASASGGERIARARITSGLNTIVANGLLGNPNDDVVVMDDFLYAEPLVSSTVPEPASAALTAIALGVALGMRGRVRRRSGSAAA
jgi:hypothetical protein